MLLAALGLLAGLGACGKRGDPELPEKPKPGSKP